MTYRDLEKRESFLISLDSWEFECYWENNYKLVWVINQWKSVVRVWVVAILKGIMDYLKVPRIRTYEKWSRPKESFCLR